MDLFAEQKRANRERVQPLAVRMRPRTLDEFAGQEHFVGPGKLLRRMLQADRLTSAVFYGPPGSGKTTLAQIIAQMTQAHFHQANAAAIGVKEIRTILAEAGDRLETGGQRSVLFLDELHRFNRAQQDTLLEDVEEGVITLIGATTENPFFTVNSPLISRSQIFRFEPLGIPEIVRLLQRAVEDRERGLGTFEVTLTNEAAEHLARTCDGDARRALTALEVAVLSQNSEPGTAIVVDREVAAESIQRKAVGYDRDGDVHYDTASALIKSIRGGDPDAAAYWLARMFEGGEDPRFIARRLVILAAEDIGNADPQGLVLAQAAAEATSFIGLPECELPLVQAAVYLACAPKSNASAKAIWEAREDVRSGRTIPVPIHLRDAHYPGASRLGHGEGYVYPHDTAGGEVAQNYLGVDRVYYRPTDRGAEAAMSAYVERYRARRSAGAQPDGEDEVDKADT
ncbi:MAG: replication-associated recombination protein A [bacterium]|nr:replication-associated recombination protein A [bacterium]